MALEAKLRSSPQDVALLAVVEVAAIAAKAVHALRLMEARDSCTRVRS